MSGAVLSHHNGRCTFETVLEHHRLDDDALWAIAQIVHEADLADERYDAPEAAGLDAIVRGLALLHGDDDLLTITAPLFDGLYAGRRAAGLDHR